MLFVITWYQYACDFSDQDCVHTSYLMFIIIERLNTIWNRLSLYLIPYSKRRSKYKNEFLVNQMYSRYFGCPSQSILTWMPLYFRLFWNRYIAFLEFFFHSESIRTRSATFMNYGQRRKSRYAEIWPWRWVLDYLYLRSDNLDFRRIKMQITQFSI